MAQAKKTVQSPREIWDKLPAQIPADILEEAQQMENPDFEFEIWGSCNPDWQYFETEDELIWSAFEDSGSWPHVRDEFVEGLVSFSLSGERTWLRIIKASRGKEKFLKMVLDHPIASRLRSVRKALLEAGDQEVLEQMAKTTDPTEVSTLFDAYVEACGETRLDWFAGSCPPECLEVLSREQWTTLAENAPQEAFQALTATAQAHEGMTLEDIEEAFAYLVHQEERAAARLLSTPPEPLARYLAPGAHRRLWRVLARSGAHEAFGVRADAPESSPLAGEVGPAEVGEVLEENALRLEALLMAAGPHALEMAGEEGLRSAWSGIFASFPKKGMELLDRFPRLLQEVLRPTDLAAACSSTDAEIRMQAITLLPLLAERCGRQSETSARGEEPELESPATGRTGRGR